MRALRVLGLLGTVVLAGLLLAVWSAPMVPTVSGPAGSVALLARSGGAPCGAAARACVDLSSQRAWLMRNGAVVYGPVPITSGKPGFRTPTGTFRITFKDRDHRSSLFNGAAMPFSVFFVGGVAFHQGSLSVPSHGCVHLSSAAAQRFFATLNPGDVVQVVP